MPLGERPIFDDTLLASERNTIVDFIKKHQFKKVIIPCAGKFTIAEAIINAGIKADMIFCSDISLTASMIGYYLSGRDLSEIGIQSEFDFINPQDAPIDVIASVLYGIMLTWARDSNYYNESYKRALELKQDQTIQDFKNNIEKMSATLKGIEYHVAGLRDRCELYKDDEDTLIIIDTPTTISAQKSMYDYDDKIIWQPPQVDIFDPKEELNGILAELETAKATVLILKQKNKQGISDAWQVLQLTVDRKINKRYLLINREVKDAIINRPRIHTTEPLDIPIIDQYHEIIEDSKITVLSVTPDIAWYYRDLFTYKFGAGSADYNFIIMVDEKIISVRGYAPLGIAGNGSLRELYGIVYNNSKYRHLGRLVARAITSSDFTKAINKSIFPITRLTTTKYKYHVEDREFKGLGYEVYESVEVKDAPGKYKIKYQAQITDTPYKDMIVAWLKEEVAYAKPTKTKKRKPRSRNQQKDQTGNQT